MAMAIAMAPTPELGAATMSTASSLRIFPELRAAHIEDLDPLRSRPTWYFELKYDVGNIDPPAHFIRVGRGQFLVKLLCSRAETLELWEPLWVRYFPRWVAAALCWRISGFVTRRRRRIGCYAIENNDLDAILLPGASAFRAFGRSVLREVVGGAIHRLVDRIAFGSSASRDTYVGLLGARLPESRVVADLPSARATTRRDPVPGRACFIGRLETRKGIELLMLAWPIVERECPQAHLIIAGDGPFLDAARAWAAVSPGTRSVLGRLERREALEVIRNSVALVAPSIRHGRWREQIGMPIREALAMGLTVVTTDESGLSEFLAATGHHVVTPSGESLASGILTALRAPVPPAAVLGSLPPVAGRDAADDWLHGE